MKVAPSLFVGHGNPMNIIGNNKWTDAWANLGLSLGRPKAIIAISAHWYIPTTMVTAMANPRTIHDFGGFPDELYKVSYPAPGDPVLAENVCTALGHSVSGSAAVSLDNTWGLDHGTWSVLSRMYPKADIPVVQLSINHRQSLLYHYEMGKLLAPFRDEGVLIFGSGNLVHNIQAYNWDDPHAAPFSWALSFEDKIRSRLQSGKESECIDYTALGRDASLAVPTPDHYLPLLYVLGARWKDDDISFPVEGFDGGSMSMIAVQIG
jgi:4,5-DOPA dioxygenase extradiol